MAKKRKSGKSGKTHQAPRKRKVNWGRVFRRAAFASVLTAIAAIAIYFYSGHKQVEYDLSVIGNGTPTVVQIHDPGCQLCQRLKRNLDSVKGDFTSDIQFKVANITSKKGRAFARQHNVPHVTLLFFDKRGQRVHTIQGVTPAEDIKLALEQLKNLRGNYRS